ncbi:hypothetical protein VAR608DRAFT_5758 [Variovorax sp. HW608]|uniref:hypothetical protein n=1 Tax=Variovorax sp. HW608 TaxID=1034889 RepID=UPI000820226C|nr:hypothetical protein [Variovorax sp. HW608]SCK55734.1 hypothetical protein VAR608DRAFT_5758 [Variovorax sp. HW608]
MAGPVDVGHAASLSSHSAPERSGPGDSPGPSDANVSRASELALQHLNERGYVPFHPALAHRFGHRAALFIGICLYWTRHSVRNNPQRQGWFHLSAREITQATTLSRREQETVRELLGRRGLLQERLAGRPAVIHYLLNLNVLGQALEVVDARTLTVDAAWSWFERSVSFYRPLADLAGNAASGLYLSFILRQQRLAILKRQLRGDCIHVPQEAVSEALRLTPKVQRAARDRLRKSGLIIEAGPSLIRLNVDAILACIRGQAIQPLPRAKGASTVSLSKPSDVSLERRLAHPGAKRGPLLPMINQPQLPMGAALPSNGGAGVLAACSPMHLIASLIAPRAVAASVPVAGFQQLAGGAVESSVDVAAIANASQTRASIAQSANLEAPHVAQSAKLEAAISAQSAKLGLPKAPNYIKQTSIPNTTTNTHASRTVGGSGDAQVGCRRRSAAFSADSLGASDLDDLNLPQCLTAQMLPGVRHVLQQVEPQWRQPMLDELEGQARIAGKTIHNPAGWLRGLARGVKAGTVLALAEQVAAERRQRQAIQAQIQASIDGRSQPRATREAIAPADPEVVQRHLAQLQGLRKHFVGKR